MKYRSARESDFLIPECVADETVQYCIRLYTLHSRLLPFHDDDAIAISREYLDQAGDGHDNTQASLVRQHMWQAE